MKTKKILLIVMFIIPFFKIVSQTNQLDPIINSSATYIANSSYNTGEVYVIFTIQNDTIVSKDIIELVEDQSEELITKSISVYPNPVTNILTIITSDDTEVNKIMLFSLDGRMILDKEIQNNQIDLTNLPVGSYLLKTDFDYSTTFKLIKL